MGLKSRSMKINVIFQFFSVFYFPVLAGQAGNMAGDIAGDIAGNIAGNIK